MSNVLLITAERADEVGRLGRADFHGRLVEALGQVETVPCSGRIPLMATHL